MAAPFQIPIAAPQSSNVLLTTPAVNISYDISKEFPNEPFQTLLAWVNIQWKVTGFYNGK